MSLLNTQTPGFEPEADDDIWPEVELPQAGAAAAQASGTVEAATAPVQAQVPVVQQQSRAVAQTNAEAMKALDEKRRRLLGIAFPSATETTLGDAELLDVLKDAYRVEYNSTTPVIANNGNLITREGKVKLGDEATVALVSYQDSFVISANDDSAPKDLVRFSDDGVVCSDGTPVRQALDDMKALGWSKAALRARVVVVCRVICANKSKEFDNQFVQLDLSPKSKVQFDRYMKTSKLQVAAGMMTVDKVLKVKITIETPTNAQNQTYSVMRFAPA